MAAGGVARISRLRRHSRPASIWPGCIRRRWSAARGGGRSLRVSWHQEAGLVVLSLWRDNACAGSFRLAAEEVPDLIDLLRSGLDRAYDAAPRPGDVPAPRHA
mgnify:CR=1 FL=1